MRERILKHLKATLRYVKSEGTFAYRDDPTLDDDTAKEEIESIISELESGAPIDESPWIPVTPETIPEHQQHVQVVTTWGSRAIFEFYNLGHSSRWRQVADSKVYDYGAVTHWMPLPELPASPEEG